MRETGKADYLNSRSLAFFTFISFVFLITGQLLLGRQGLLVGFLIASAFNFYIYFLSEKRVLHVFDAQPVVGQDIWGIQGKLKKICASFRTAYPKIYITQSPSPISFSMSRGWGHTRIIISEKLLQELNSQEIEDLLTLHVFYTIAKPSLYVGFRTLLCEVFFIFAQFADFIINIPFYLAKSKKVVFTQKLFLPIGQMIQNSFRKDLIAMDEHVAQAIGSKERLASLLWKLNSLNHNTPSEAPPSCALVFSVNPLTETGLHSYFQRHFTLETRIKALVGNKTI